MEEAGTDYEIMIECSSSETNETISVSSPQLFHVHDFPETGMLRQTVTTFGFKGPLNKVANILKAFEGSMGSATCKGCPPGTVSRLGQSADGDEDAGSYNECWSPLADQDLC